MAKIAKERKKNMKAERTSPLWCSCGYKINGKNHEDGVHHQHGKGKVPKPRR